MQCYRPLSIFIDFKTPGFFQEPIDTLMLQLYKHLKTCKNDSNIKAVCNKNVKHCLTIYLWVQIFRKKTFLIGDPGAQSPVQLSAPKHSH